VIRLGLFHFFYSSAFLFLILTSECKVASATTCTPGQASVIGTEFIATQCSWESSAFTYKGTDVICQSGTVIRDPNTSGDTTYSNMTPASFQQMLVSQAQYFNMKVFRNTEGTRFLLVTRYFGNGGSIDSKSMTPYPAAPTVNTNVFDKVIFVNPSSTPPCCLQIQNFSANKASFSPSVSETVTFTGTATANYPINWIISVSDRTSNGSSGTASMTWDGKNAAGTIVAPGTYSAGLTASTSAIACTVNASAGVAVAGPPPELCSDDIDNNGNGLVNEGCFANSNTLTCN
jgi:hypothetical protein